MKVIKYSFLSSMLFAACYSSAKTFDLDKLSTSGFIDMSWQYKELGNGESSSDIGVDQAEIDLTYQVDDKLSFTADIEYQNASEGVDLEQMYLNYDFANGFSVKAGRFLSNSGFESEEPTGLYQYSGTGYAPYFYGYYQQGVSVGYANELMSAAVSVVSDLAGPQSTDFKQPGVEVMLAITPSKQVTVKSFYSFEQLEGTNEDVTLFNLWASYNSGPLTLGAEYNTSENAPAYALGEAGLGSEARGGLVMANYEFDRFGLTLRYHDWSVENDASETVEKVQGFTISPNFNINESTLITMEYRVEDIDDEDVTSVAIEALVTF